MTSKRGEQLGGCFVIQPFDKGGSFDRRYADVYEPAIRAAGLEPYRVDRDFAADNIVETIEEKITESHACFAEITLDNPNVWYELGYARAKGKQICMVCSEERTGGFPFDIQHRKVIKYNTGSSSDFGKLTVEITARLKTMVQQVATVEATSGLKPTTLTHGLSPHEATALLLIFSESDQRGLSKWQLKDGMRKAGFLDIATKIATHKLIKANLVANSYVEDERGEPPYETFSITQAGTDWILANEGSLVLREERGSPGPEDDAPF